MNIYNNNKTNTDFCIKNYKDSYYFNLYKEF